MNLMARTELLQVEMGMGEMELMAQMELQQVTMAMIHIPTRPPLT
jgi:hypothetical protein